MHWTSPAPTKDSASLHLVYLCKAKDKHHQDQAGPFSRSVSGEPEIHHLLTGKSPSQMFQAAIRKTKYADTFIKLL